MYHAIAGRSCLWLARAAIFGGGHHTPDTLRVVQIVDKLTVAVRYERAHAIVTMPEHPATRVCVLGRLAREPPRGG